ncbi:hypothetical protein QJS10_CPB12g01331 [Acorus calamus]|uniref:SWIRM domain-containing protein n=1 Tax=Acorus calamus TaxID=4465 RepID=A0AAV9DPV5_ACOCL|nr:hypothetical protein QJS10_CPB12g01331 [Acorus calamus]
MVPINGLRVLRPPPKAGPVSYREDDLAGDIDASAAAASAGALPRRGRRGRRRDLARELDMEALVAASVGFPADSLTEEEIEWGVVASLGGRDQSNYIVVRNHILSLWRSNVSSWLTFDDSTASIRSEHRPLVRSAYDFLLHHSYINFGLSPAIKNHPPLALPSPDCRRKTIVIVGAGLAGLAAGRHLLSLGFRVAIVEGRNRPGGRVLTRKMRGRNVVVAADLGGSVLTGINGNPFGVLARQLCLPLHKVRDKCPLYLPDGRPVDPEIDRSVESAFNRLLDKVCKLRQAMTEGLDLSADVSLGSALEAFRKAYGVAEGGVNSKEERMLLDWHLANLEYANATLLSDLSMVFWDQDDPYEMGGDHCFIPGGNSHFVRALAEGLPIFYGKPIDAVHYGSDGVIAYARDGQAFRGDIALITVPLGVLKRGTIRFVPDLPPHKQEAISRLGFGLLNKVAMLFPWDFWGGGIDTFGHLTEDPCKRGEFFLFYSYSSVSGGPLLVALVAGESAIKFESMHPMDPVERVLEILKGIFGPMGIEVPNPIQAVCTRWGSDPFTYGSYSYVAVGSSGDDYDVLAESIGDERVFFAGEATNRRYPATMHGAFLSGLREAANISRVVNRRSAIPSEEVNVEEDALDLEGLFRSPNMSFGDFSVLFDPDSEDLEALSLVRVRVGEKKLGSGPLFLYGLIPKKQVIEVSEVNGDEERLSVLYGRFGAKLVGTKGLDSVGEAMIARVRAAKYKLS